MSRLIDRPGYAWVLILVAAAAFYVVTESLRGAAICLLLEIGLWTVIRHLRSWQRPAQERKPT